MRTLWIVILVVSIIGNVVGGYLLYKVYKLRAEIQIIKGYLDNMTARYTELKNDFAGTSEYRAANADLLHATTPEQRREMTVLFGASITRRWDLEKYFPGKRLINRGVGAQSNTQLLTRFSADVLRLEPGRVVIKFCSGNFNPDADFEQMWDEYETMAVMAGEREIKPMLATIIPVTRGAETYEGYAITENVVKFNDRIRKLATEKNLPVVDYFKAMADSEDFLPDSLARDTIHPNENGYAIMAGVLKPLLP